MKAMARHWIDEYADALYNELIKRGKEEYVFNGGLSVSGLQHIGRLRGEIILVEVLRKILSKRGLRIKQYITLYTMDEWKGKESQLKEFNRIEDAVKYVGNPLIRIPDPKGCHRNWVEHYWNDFGPYIREFTDGDITPVMTSDLYNDGLREFVKITIMNRERVREVINKYRGRKKYPQNWIPFQPVCGKCGRINSTQAIEVVGERVRYRCSFCGYEGETSISDGKLNWRIEWTGVWWALKVDFEPYGKDHATPGGSRDSCNDLARNVYGFEPPLGTPYEWVSIRIGGVDMDMTSSGFIGITPRDWLEIAHPHILRFLVLKTPLAKKISIDLANIPQYYQQYYQAERIYYGLESVADEETRVLLARSYELSYPHGDPPKNMPEQIPYTHLAILSQIVPRNLWVSEGVRRLKMIKLLPDQPSEHGLRRALELIVKSNNWVNKYGPEEMRIKLLEKPAEEVLKTIPEEHRVILKKMAKLLEELDSWDEENIKQAMINATMDLGMKEKMMLYQSFYKLFLGKPEGPRAAPFLAILGKETSLKYFSYL